jgi:starch phosphorylase
MILFFVMKKLPSPSVAYFSMEVALEPKMPTYSGGLGVLAGDMLKSFADLEMPLVGLCLLYHRGYFEQKIDETGWQKEQPTRWDPHHFLKLQNNIIELTLEGRVILAQAWLYELKGTTGHIVPVYFLDTDLPENHPDDRSLTHYLYGGDLKYRLKQEALLGVGGVRLLKSVGLYPNIKTFHMNEGHAALLTLELLNDHNYIDSEVAQYCTFTTHTPVPAGHDHFPYDMAHQVLGSILPWHIQKIAGFSDLNMTTLAMNLSRYRNSVAQKHGEVSRNLFPGYQMDAITNGIHPMTWVSKPFHKIFDENFPSWKTDEKQLLRALDLPEGVVWKAHQENKKKLLDYIIEKTGEIFDLKILTIGFGRRAAPYKRASLIFHDVEKLAKICKGRVQFVFAGKAHPRDDLGKKEIQKVIESINQINKTYPDKIRVVFLENYNMETGALMTAGVDVWLNNPIRPREASGTSGMKAAINGVLNFSVLDGWWIEGHEEDITGWSIGAAPQETALTEQEDAPDALDFYEKLEYKVIPLYYQNQAGWIKMMKNAMGKNGSQFNTHRVVKEYARSAYQLEKALASTK